MYCHIVCKVFCIFYTWEKTAMGISPCKIDIFYYLFVTLSLNFFYPLLKTVKTGKKYCYPSIYFVDNQ